MKRETINQIAHTGICLGNDAILAAVDKIRKEFDSAAKNSKSLIEDQFENVVENPEDNANNNEDLELSRAMATSEANIDDKLNESSDEKDTILYSDDDKMPEDSRATPTNEDNESGDEEKEETESEEEIEEEEVEEDDDDQDENISFDEGILAAAPPISDDEESMEVEAEDNESMITTAEEGPKVLHPGFTLCWDNVGKKVTTRHPSQPPPIRI